jgi:hypothetical protein
LEVTRPPYPKTGGEVLFHLGEITVPMLTDGILYDNL